MRVLFVSSEMEPLAKVGGLADVVGVLPSRLKHHGCDVRVVIPCYRQTKKNIRNLDLEARDLGIEFQVDIDGATRRGRVKELPIEGVRVYILQNEAFFDREFIYSTHEADYEDNDLRFGFLSLGALEVAKALDFKPDIIHCHDWQTALVPICLRWREGLRDEAFFNNSKVVFTIHNISYQGLFDRGLLHRFALPDSLFAMEGIEFYGRVNLLKGGILYSDLVTTVSPTYAQEVKNPQYGYGLDGVLRWISDNRQNFVGILNGIDYDHWNPETDRALYVRYGPDDIEGKLGNKRRFKLELGMDSGMHSSPDKPLLGMVSRLAEQKGTDLVVETLPEIFELGFQLVILGSGDEKFERMLESAAWTHKGNLFLYLGFNEDFARRVYAASDMFLMPSRFEPCGLGNLISLRYGTIPVVRGTGGLLDTIVDYTEDSNRGNGFVFHDFSKEGLLDALRRALAVYRKPKEWVRLASTSMNADFSWRKKSERYLEFYQKLRNER